MNRNHASVGPIDPEKHRENGDVVTAYILDHPEKPMSPTDRTDDPVRCEWASGGGGTRTSASGDRSGGDICKQNGPAGPTLPSGSGSGPSIHEHVGTVGSSHRPSLPLSKHCCCPSGTPGKEGNPISAFVDVVKSSPAKPGVSHRFRRDWTAYRRTDSLYPSG